MSAPDGRKRRGGAAVALAGMTFAGAAVAEEASAPPRWALLAECSAVFSAVADLGGAPPAEGVPDPAGARVTAQALLERAETAAGRAGRPDPATDVASVMSYLVPRWRNRADGLLNLRSNLRWIEFCGRLGREEGILPIAPPRGASAEKPAQ